MKNTSLLSVAFLSGALLFVGAACSTTTTTNTAATTNSAATSNESVNAELTNENGNVAEETNTNAVMESNENANTAATNAATNTNVAATNTTASTNATVATKAVLIDNFAFADSTIAVKKGAKVTWTNNDAASHTVTSATGVELSSGTLNSGKTYSHTFDKVGTYPYKCTLHPTMTGTVIVTE